MVSAKGKRDLKSSKCFEKERQAFRWIVLVSNH
jgi:hypothetical protein